MSSTVFVGRHGQFVVDREVPWWSGELRFPREDGSAGAVHVQLSAAGAEHWPLSGPADGAAGHEIRKARWKAHGRLAMQIQG